VTDIIAVTEQFAKMLESLTEEWEQLVDGVSQTDLETQDLLHEIELTKFNAVEGYMLTSKLKEIRLRRREIKNDLEVYSSFKDTFYANNKNLSVTLFKALKKLNTIREGQERKHYTPRVRDDLKLAQKEETA
jgi:hypothetical protein